MSIMVPDFSYLIELSHTKIDSRLEYLFSFWTSGMKDLSGGGIWTNEIFKYIKLGANVLVWIIVPQVLIVVA